MHMKTKTKLSMVALGAILFCIFEIKPMEVGSTHRNATKTQVETKIQTHVSEPKKVRKLIGKKPIFGFVEGINKKTKNQIKRYKNSIVNYNAMTITEKHPNKLYKALVLNFFIIGSLSPVVRGERDIFKGTDGVKRRGTIEIGSTSYKTHNFKAFLNSQQSIINAIKRSIITEAHPQIEAEVRAKIKKEQWSPWITTYPLAFGAGVGATFLFNKWFGNNK
jgi:hypothetical protein